MLNISNRLISLALLCTLTLPETTTTTTTTKHSLAQNYSRPAGLIQKKSIKTLSWILVGFKIIYPRNSIPWKLLSHENFRFEIWSGENLRICLIIPKNLFPWSAKILAHGNGKRIFLLGILSRGGDWLGTFSVCRFGGHRGHRA